MRGFEEKEITEVRTERVESSVTCNKCGKTTQLQGEWDFGANEYQSFSTYFSYGSRFDMESWEFDLCEDCLIELVRSFMHAPEGFGQGHYIVAYPQITFEKWKETGVIDLEAGMTAEEIAENGGSIYVDEEEE